MAIFPCFPGAMATDKVLRMKSLYVTESLYDLSAIRPQRRQKVSVEYVEVQTAKKDAKRRN